MEEDVTDLSESPAAVPPSHFSPEQKTGFVLLLIFSFIAIGLGFLQIRNTMYEPFALSNKIPVTLKDQVNTPDALRFRDTDKDGLSDFDELYVYGTSQYLYDTFGYGLSDKEVVAKGLALCPGAGKNCQTAAVSPGLSTTSTPASSAIVSSGAIQDATLADPNAGAIDIAAILSDPSQVREILVQGGVDKNVLKNITDAELLKTVQNIVSSSSSLISLTYINIVISTTLSTKK